MSEKADIGFGFSGNDDIGNIYHHLTLPIHDNDKEKRC
jgi:hypothetical protein